VKFGIHTSFAAGIPYTTDRFKSLASPLKRSSKTKVKSAT
jgi:hypothetical protein